MLFSLPTSSLLLQCLVLLPKWNLYWTALPTQPVWSGRPAAGLISTSSKLWEWRNMRQVVRLSHSPAFLRSSCAATPTTSVSLPLTVCATSPPVASHSWEQVKSFFLNERLNGRRFQVYQFYLFIYIFILLKFAFYKIMKKVFGI